jgi:hypothetical protein
MLQAGFSSVKIWWKNEKTSFGSKTRPASTKLAKLNIGEDKNPKIDKEEGEGGGESEGEEGRGEEESEEEKDELSGDEMDEYAEVETIKQTKRWNALLIGLL